MEYNFPILYNSELSWTTLYRYGWFCDTFPATPYSRMYPRMKISPAFEIHQCGDSQKKAIESQGVYLKSQCSNPYVLSPRKSTFLSLHEEVSPMNHELRFSSSINVPGFSIHPWDRDMSKAGGPMGKNPSNWDHQFRLCILIKELRRTGENPKKDASLLIILVGKCRSLYDLLSTMTRPIYS